MEDMYDHLVGYVERERERTVVLFFLYYSFNFHSSYIKAIWIHPYDLHPVLIIYLRV